MSSDVYVTLRSPADVTGMEIAAFGTDQRLPMTGFYKTVMQWLKCFFTEEGSDPGDLSYGTRLAGYIGGAVASSSDLQDAAALSVKGATQTIKGYQRGKSLPAAEVLSSVTLTGVEVDADRVDLYIVMVNGAGESLQLAVPAKTPSFKF